MNVWRFNTIQIWQTQLIRCALNSSVGFCISAIKCSFQSIWPHWPHLCCFSALFFDDSVVLSNTFISLIFHCFKRVGFWCHSIFFTSLFFCFCCLFYFLLIFASKRLSIFVLVVIMLLFVYVWCTFGLFDPFFHFIVILFYKWMLLKHFLQQNEAGLLPAFPQSENKNKTPAGCREIVCQISLHPFWIRSTSLTLLDPTCLSARAGGDKMQRTQCFYRNAF